MNTVTIKGLKVRAKHGVFPSEKQNAQPFLIDITYKYGGKAAESDNFSNAVDYAAVCALAQKICGENTFDLIEKLAREIALGICENFPAVSEAEVTVHKPEAPVGMEFSDIFTTQKVERVKAILSLGSSMGDKKAALDGACAALGNTRGIEIKKISSYLRTKPYGGVATGEFLNCALLAECLLTPEELLEKIHDIESSFGRERKIRWGDRTLDIDIVFFGDRIIEKEGLCIPHPDYFNRDFVLAPIKEIAPDFVCPRLHRRVSDL